MQRPLPALLLVVLAALITVLSGPSAAAATPHHGTSAASVEGPTPHGEDASLRVGDPQAPAEALPAELAPAPVHAPPMPATSARGLVVVDGPGHCPARVRGPPGHAAP